MRFSVLAEWAADSASGWQNGGRAPGGGFGGLSLTSRCKDRASVRPGCRYASFRVVNSGRNYAKCVCNSLRTSIIEEQQSHFLCCKKCVSRRGRNAVLEGRGNPFRRGRNRFFRRYAHRGHSPDLRSLVRAYLAARDAPARVRARPFSRGSGG